MKKVFLSCLSLSAAAMMSGCGGGDTSSDSVPASGTGNFSLAVTDAPIDDATKVVVEFNGVTVKPVDGEPFEFEFDAPISVDLLALQGHVSEYLVANEALPVGEYEWIRFDVNAEEDGVLDSYIEFEDGTQEELSIPSGERTGLKIGRRFEISETEDADLTIDFDLRKSIVHRDREDGHFGRRSIMKPRLRFAHTRHSGAIEGKIDPMIIAEQCAEGAEEFGAVYVFAEGVELNDLTGAETDALASAQVKLKREAYKYEVGFLEPGTYQLAYTCDAALDDPETDDEVNFLAASEATVLEEAHGLTVNFGDIPEEEHSHDWMTDREKDDWEDAEKAEEDEETQSDNDRETENGRPWDGEFEGMDFERTEGGDWMGPRDRGEDFAPSDESESDDKKPSDDTAEESNDEGAEGKIRYPDFDKESKGDEEASEEESADEADESEEEADDSEAE